MVKNIFVVGGHCFRMLTFERGGEYHIDRVWIDNREVTLAQWDEALASAVQESGFTW